MPGTEQSVSDRIRNWSGGSTVRNAELADVYDSLPPVPDSLSAARVAESLGWSLAKTRAALMDLRTKGHVTYEPRGYRRRWGRSA